MIYFNMSASTNVLVDTVPYSSINDNYFEEGITS